MMLRMCAVLLLVCVAGDVTMAKDGQPLGTDSVSGQVIDGNGRGVGGISLTLLRRDQTDSQIVQTSAAGSFSSGHLDPRGTYTLLATPAEYEPFEVALHSADGKPLTVEVRLHAQVIPIGDPTASTAVVRKLFEEGRRLAEDHKHQLAIEKYAQTLSIDMNYANVRAYKALSHLALGQIGDADKEIVEALRLNAGECTFYQVAGATKIAQNQVVAGRGLYDKAALLSPKNAGMIYADLAATLATRGDDRLAGDIDSALKAAVSAEPPARDALFQLGQTYASAGRAEGKTYLQRYLDAENKLPDGQRDAQKMKLARQLIKALEAVNAAP